MYSTLRERSNCVVNHQMALILGCGSNVSSSLFLIYVNAMEVAVFCRPILYADQSALLVSGKDVGLIEGRLGDELSSLNVWLVWYGRLSIHLGKTE